MATVLKNPNLTDYFTEADGSRPVIEDYEAGKVILLRRRFEIDTDLWASLCADDDPRLKKLSFTPDGRPLPDLTAFGFPPAIQVELQSVLDQLLPVYQTMFADYKFVRPKAVLRLQTIRAENLHIDLYGSELPDHFARMFVNLDNQPRIWHTGYTFEELVDRFGRKLRGQGLEGDRESFRRALCQEAFGASPLEWWDDQPRHITFFDPGDVWVVDSRQVSHQIFYGRRALSIDFLVDPQSMHRPERHHLVMAGRARDRLLQTA